MTDNGTVSLAVNIPDDLLQKQEDDKVIPPGRQEIDTRLTQTELFDLMQFGGLGLNLFFVLILVCVLLVLWRNQGNQRLVEVVCTHKWGKKIGLCSIQLPKQVPNLCT